MRSLKERALAAYRQRDEMEESKRLLRLKAKVQEITGIAVEPTENLVEAEGLFFRVTYEPLGKRDTLEVTDDPSRVDNRWMAVSSLADIGEALDWWCAVDTDPGDPEEEAA